MRLVAALLFAAFAGGWAAAAPPPAETPSAPAAGRVAQSGQPPGEGPLPFRRVFAPANRADQWPLEPGQYLPVDAAAFEQLVEAAQAEPGTGGAQLMSAQYEARLEGEALVGRARLRFEHSAARPALARLAPCNLALGEASWITADGAQAAVVGNRADGSLAALVEESGTLEWTWSAGSESIGTAGMGFRLDLPQCPINHLLLDVPPQMAVLVDRGVAARVADAADGYGQWRIETGGHSRLYVRVMAEEAAPERRQLLLVRQATTYALAPQGVDVVAEFRLDVHHEPLARLAVQLDPGLRLVAAKIGEVDVPWTFVDEGPHRPARAVLEFAEPVLGVGRTLRLSGLAPLPVGPGRLPGLSIAGAFWQEGAATLLVPSPLRILDLRLQGARLTRTAPLAGPGPGESLELQLFRPDATLELVVGRPEEAASVRCGSQIVRSASEAVATTLLQMNARAGERFTVRARVRGGWQIESVDSQTTQAVVDWSVRERAEGGAELLVQLGAALSPRNPLRLVIGARQAVSLDRIWSADDLVPVEPLDARLERRLAAVRTDEPWQLAVAGDGPLLRLDPARLAVADASLFAEAPSGLAFVVDDGAADLTLRLVDARPHLSIVWNLEVLARQDRLEQTCRASVEPQAGSVERLLVHFSQAHPQPWRWSLSGAEEGPGSPPLSARRLAPDEQAALGVGEPGETWEVLLRLARAAPFTLVAQRTQPLGPNQAVDLAAALDVEDQRGTVVVRAAESLGLHLASRRLKAVPFEALAGLQREQQAAYRYEPRRDALAPGPALLVAATEISPPPPTAWAWSLDLDTRYGDGAPTVHVATWLLENDGRTNVELAVPAEAQLAGVWIDGQRAGREGTPDARGKLALQLPARARWIVLRAALVTPSPAIRWTASIAPPHIALDVPVLRKRWRLRLPHELEIVSAPETVAPHRAGRTWSQRLFGPLGRRADGERFHPFAAASWAREFGAASADPHAAEELSQLVERLGQALLDPERPAGLTWGQLLSAWANWGAGQRPTLLVDAAALAAAEIVPQTPVPPVDDRAPRDAAARLLAEAGLVVCAVGPAMVVTAAEAASTWQPLPAALPRQNGFVLRVAAPAGQRDDAPSSWEAHGWLAAERWDADPRWSSTRWSLVRGGQWREPAVVERTYLLELPAAAPAVVVGRSTALTAGFWAVLLGLVAAGAWTTRRHRTFWCGLAAVAGGLALLVPAAWSLPLAPVFAGALVSATLQWVRRAEPASAPERPSASTRRASSIVRATAVVGTAGTLLSAALAQDTAPPPGQRVPTVFVPVDDLGRPTGGRVQVPQALYRELHRRASAATNEPRGCLLRQAVYRVAPDREAAPQGWRISELRIGWDVVALEADATLRLPLPKATTSLAPPGVRVDGRPVLPTWDHDEAQMMLPLQAAGPHRVELTVALPTKAGSVGVDLAVPPAAHARLEWAAPPDAPGVRFPSAHGQRTQPSADGVARIELGSADRLQIAWQEGAAPGGAPPVDVEELLWLHVQPGSVALEAKLRYRPGKPLPERMRLLCDARLRLLPSAANDPAASVVVGSSGSRRTIDVVPRPNSADPASIDLKFLLTGTSGLGNLRLPQLEVAGARLRRRLLAVSIDPALEYEAQAEPAVAALQPLAVPEFLAAWGAQDVQPLLAYTLDENEPSWILTTRPRETRLSCAAQLAVSVGRESATMRWTATVAGADGGHFLLQIAVPPQFEVERVTALADGVDQVSRWARTGENRLTVFLRSELAPRSQLTVEGRAPCPRQGAWRVPALSVVGADDSTAELALYQQPAAAVSPPPELAPLADRQPPLVPAGWGALVGMYRTDPALPPTIQLRPNAGRTEAQLVVSMDRGDGGWVAQADARLLVQDGWQDAVRLRIPPQWTGPFSLEQPGTLEVVAIPGGRERVLVARLEPPVAAGATQRVSVRGRVVAPAGERLRVPDVSLVGLKDVRRFVALPSQVAEQTLVWETLGLTPATLPAELALPLPAGSFAAYQAPGERFEAALQVVEHATRVPIVRLADICAWRSGEEVAGVAAFTVDPAGADACELEIPTGQRPLAVRVGGAPAAWTAAGPGRLRVAIGPQQLPQRLELVFVGRDDSAQSVGDSERLPGIADLRCQRTLLTTCADAKGPSPTTAADTAAAPADLDLARLDVLAEDAQLAAELAGEQAPLDGAAWAKPWRNHLAWVASRLARRAADGGRVALPGRRHRDPEQTSAQIASALQRLEPAPATPEARPNTPGPTVDYLALALDQLACSGQETVERELTGRARVLPTESSGAVRDAPWARSLAALALAAGLALVAFASARWPLAGVSAATGAAIAGLIAWLWLAPSGAGLALAVVALVVRARQARRAAWPD